MGLILEVIVIGIVIDLILLFLSLFYNPIFFYFPKHFCTCFQYFFYHLQPALHNASVILSSSVLNVINYFWGEAPLVRDSRKFVCLSVCLSVYVGLTIIKVNKLLTLIAGFAPSMFYILLVIGINSAGIHSSPETSMRKG